MTSDDFNAICHVEKTQQSLSAWRFSKWWTRMWELEVICPPDESTTDATVKQITFLGRRRTTKDILLTFMYEDDIAGWVEREEREERKKRGGPRRKSLADLMRRRRHQPRPADKAASAVACTNASVIVNDETSF